MNEVEFDKALSDFLDDEECEKVNETVYGLIRAAFAAGWKAALGSDLGSMFHTTFTKGVPYGDPGCDRPL